MTYEMIFESSYLVGLFMKLQIVKISMSSYLENTRPIVQFGRCYGRLSAFPTGTCFFSFPFSFYPHIGRNLVTNVVETVAVFLELYCAFKS